KRPIVSRSRPSSGSGPASRTSSSMTGTVERARSRPGPRRRPTWREGAPPARPPGGGGRPPPPAPRRSRQIGARALQIFGDNPTAWRRRPEPSLEAPEFVGFGEREGLRTIAIHASYLINLAGTA